MAKLSHKDINKRVMAKLQKLNKPQPTAALQSLKTAAGEMKGRQPI